MEFDDFELFDVNVNVRVFSCSGLLNILEHDAWEGSSPHNE